MSATTPFLSTVIFSTALMLAPMAQAAGNAEAGKAKSAACAACHGADGNSAAPNFPKLAGQGERYIVEQLKAMKSGTRPVPMMASFVKNMSEQDMADLGAYFQQQKGSTGQARKDLAQLGARVYRAGDEDKKLPACSGCHSPSGSGNAPAGFPKLGGQHADYIAAQLNAYRSGDRTTGGEARIMQTIAERMTDKEIEAVSSFISGLH